MAESAVKKINKSFIDTPLRKDAFELSDQEKMKRIEQYFTQIMQTLGLNLFDDSLGDTPKRVAKMYVQEIFGGLNPKTKPNISLFDNKYHYNRMLVEKNITLYSTCEHHFLPIIGKVHVAYFPNEKVIGLSKINRLVEYYAQRPQVQERLTIQIAEGLKEALSTEDIAVMIEADHLCVASRGIKDTQSATITDYFSGRFENDETKNKFILYINR